MTKYTFIVNPQAGKGRGEELLQRIRTLIAQRQLVGDIFVTKGPNDATQIAKSCTGHIVVAVGGDGTVNEVVNGIVGSSKILGVIPAGSGNDLIKSIGIPRTINGAFQALTNGKAKRVDCATVTCGTQGNSATRFFVNGVGIGFDAAVAERTNQIKFLSGTLVYILAVFQTLGKYKAPDFSIEVDSDRFQSRNLLIAIGNGRCAGGGFYLTPHALVDDGVLDVCMIDDISLMKILQIMPKVMKGNHISAKEVTMTRCKILRAQSSTPFFVHADGEIVGSAVTNVEIQIHEKGLHAIIGEGI